MARIIMCGSFKGGVGKTASSWNLAYSLAEMGKRVLAVDFDSQANLTTCFGIEDSAAVPVTIGHLMMNRLEDEEMPDPSEFIQSRNGVDFIPSSMMLSAVDSKLRMEMGSEKMLAGILEPLRGLYDYIIVDTCPSLGTLTINALTAADEVIIAVNPQLLAMMGLQDFIRTVKKVRSRLNERLSIAGILLTMCDARTNLCKVITEQLTDTFDGQIRIFKSIIPNTVKVGESIYYSEPLQRAGTVYVFGGGHVAQELVPVIAHVGFKCVVYDDRPEFANSRLFPDAVNTIVGDFTSVFDKVTIREQDYVVIMTRGHQCDYDVQKQVLKTPAHYIGVMGSRQKLMTLAGKLKAEGFTDRDIERFYSPIGLAILAETPAEIAISVAGELIMVRARREGRTK